MEGGGERTTCAGILYGVLGVLHDVRDEVIRTTRTLRGGVLKRVICLCPSTP